MEGNEFRWALGEDEEMCYFPFTSLKILPRVVFDQEVFDKYRYGPNRCFLHLPWMYSILVENNVLWNYPVEQSEWLQQCMDMLPPTPNLPYNRGNAPDDTIENTMDYWTLDAVRKRFKYIKLW